MLEEVARHDVSAAICCQLAYNGPPRGIEHLGSDALKDRWLPAVADGEAIVSIGITEPDAGSAVQGMRTALAPDGSSWRLNGYKNYSTLGHAAAGVLVWCRWPGGEGARGIGAVVVPMDRDGVALTGRHRGMGIHAATESEIAFDGVLVTEDDVLVAGDPSSNEPFKLLLSHLNHERCGNAAMCVGAAQGALERSVDLHARPGHRRAAHRRAAGSPVEAGRHGRGPGGGAPAARPGGAGWPARAGRRRPSRRPWPRRRPTWPPSTSATRPSRSTVATATAASTRWNGPTGTSAGCASGPARSRRSATTSARASWPAGPPPRRVGSRRRGSWTARSRAGLLRGEARPLPDRPG